MRSAEVLWPSCLEKLLTVSCHITSFSASLKGAFCDETVKHRMNYCLWWHLSQLAAFRKIQLFLVPFFQYFLWHFPLEVRDFISTCPVRKSGNVTEMWEIIIGGELDHHSCSVIFKENQSSQLFSAEFFWQCFTLSARDLAYFQDDKCHWVHKTEQFTFIMFLIWFLTVKIQFFAVFLYKFTFFYMWWIRQ